VDLAELAVDFPKQLHRVRELAASGGFEVHLRTGELEPLVSPPSGLANRIAAAARAAAVIDALAELSATREPHGG
jgi:ubiquinone biosynthesis protein